MIALFKMIKQVKFLMFICAPPVVVVVGLYLIFYYTNVDATKMCDQMAGPAIVLAGFSTAAFHLRFRLIDGICKIEKKTQVEHLISVFQDCRKNIDYCLLVFVLATVLMVIGKFNSCIHPIAHKWIVIAAGGAFTHCMIKFMQILNALKLMEDFTLSRAVDTAKHN